MSEIILNPGEVEFYVQALKKTNIFSIGTLEWFEEQQQLEKLRQQCLFEASSCVYERVKDIILLHEKLPVLIYEAICVQIWRDKVFRNILLSSGKELKHGFLGYMILYHECIAINFLQIMFHHRDVVQTLTDEAIDLVDYCAIESIRLCTIKEEIASNDCEEKSELHGLKISECEMAMNRGLSCLAIIASLSEYLDDLSVSCIDRLYNTHDFPILIVQLMEVRPWERVNSKTLKKEVYNEGQWAAMSSGEICKSEAQCWFILRGLLLHEAAKQYYHLSEYRKQSLIKIQKYLHEHVIDQISPLIELRRFLCNLSVWNPPKVTKSPILIEAVAEIRNALLANGAKWKKLCERNINLLFDGDKENAMEIAKRMSQTYDSVALAQEAKKQDIGKCELCGEDATKKCSLCRCTWYCSRSCQVKAWENHKPQCQVKKEN